MHQLKRSSVLMLALIVAMTSFAQRKKLKIGDSIPAMSFENLLNYSSGSLSFSALKGKVILLDFWNHHCVPCFTAFPKLDSIQKKFNNKLQIILVNRESKEATIAFFKKWKKIKMPGLPLITGDTILRSLFPSNGLPYTVWIDERGVVKHFSGVGNTTIQHVGDFIDAKTINLSNASIPKTLPPSLAAVQDDTQFTYYSSISQCHRYTAGGASTGSKTPDGKFMRMKNACRSAVDLIKFAFEEAGRRNFSTAYSIDVEIKEASRWMKPEDPNEYDRWRDSNTYHFELLVPLENAGERWEYMRQDLQRFFPLKAWVEYRKTPSVILKVIDATKIPKGNGTSINDWENLKYGDIAAERLRLYNQPFSSLVDYVMSWFIYQHPFFVEGNLDSSVSVDVRAGSAYPPNVELLNEDLQRYGLKLSIEERSIPVLVIRDK